jgi:YVTN family beta-propeller protein
MATERNGEMTRLTRSIALASIGVLVIAPHSGLVAQNLKLRVFQNAMAGDAVSIIDPATNKVVGEIPDIEINNGLAAAPDGGRLYVTGEVTRTLNVVDTKAMSVTKKVPLSGRPSAVAISHDGRRLYVGVQDQGGSGIDIVDATTLTVVKNVPLEGMRTHYVLVTPDGKYVVATANTGFGPDPNKEALTIRIVGWAAERPDYGLVNPSILRLTSFSSQAGRDRPALIS